jgi:hypothetical protein
VADVRLGKKGAPLQQLARTDSMEVYKRVYAACGGTGPNVLARVAKDRPDEMSRAVSRELNWAWEGATGSSFLRAG